MIIKITNNGLNDTIEKYIITKTKCKPPNSYQKLKNKTVSKIVNSIHNKFGSKINERIIISINSSYMKDYIVKHYNNLYKYESQILENYPTTDILDLSKTFDLSPVTIFKMVFERKYNIEIIVVEQDIKKMVTLDPCVNHILAYNNGDFNRAWGFNVGSKVAKGNILIFGDGDVFLEHDQFSKFLDIVFCLDSIVLE
jgi:predicted glycosyltransferase involved in capsule biosynthesis